MSPLGFWDQIVCMLTGHEPAVGQRYVLRTWVDIQKTAGGNEDSAFEVVLCRRCGVLFWAAWVGA